ncbi:MAG: permease [Candidatus Zixiibacteriota bacterium]
MDVLGFLSQFIREFVSLTILVLPYFLIGVLTGVILQTYLKKETALKYLGQGNSSVINATLLGAILPGCSCATIPVASGIKASGARLGTVTAFILVSPLLSPHTLVLNYGLLGWQFTIARIVFSLLSAIIIGVVYNYLEARHINGFAAERTILPIAVDSCGTDNCGCPPRKKNGFLTNLWSILKSLSKYFILGMVIASLLTTLIPENAISDYISPSGPLAYISSVLVGIPLYVCEGEEVPITLALLKLGMGVGPSFAFLLGSVGTCIPTFIMAHKIIGKIPLLIYVGWWLIFTIGSGLTFQLFYPAWG